MASDIKLWCYACHLLAIVNDTEHSHIDLHWAGQQFPVHERFWTSHRLCRHIHQLCFLCQTTKSIPNKVMATRGLKNYNQEIQGTLAKCLNNNLREVQARRVKFMLSIEKCAVTHYLLSMEKSHEQFTYKLRKMDGSSKSRLSIRWKLQ